MAVFIQFTEYVPTDWVNGTTPAINEANLNKIEDALKTNRDGLISIGPIPPNGFDDKVNTIPEETGAFKLFNMVYMTQASYDALSPVTDTLYVIKG